MILFRIFWIFYFGSQKLLSVASVHRTDAPFCRESVCFSGSQSVYGDFQGISETQELSKSNITLRNALLTGVVSYQTIHQIFPYQNFDLNEKNDENVVEYLTRY